MPDAAHAPVFDGVIVVGPGADRVVGGLRLLERSAFSLARAGVRRVLCLGNEPTGAWRLPDVPITWSTRSDPSLATWLAAASPRVLTTATTTVVDPATIAALAAADGQGSLAAPRPAVLWRSDPAALAVAMTSDAGFGVEPPPSVPTWHPPASGLLHTVTDAASRNTAEHALYARLGRSGDGWFTRHVDRRFSRALTRLLLPTGVHPNVVTMVSISIGILGGCCFAVGTPTAVMTGALLFLLSTIVDGCDGEIARLTFRESPLGARLDILGDNLVHLFLFGGIATGLYRRSGDPGIALLGAALVVGVCAAMAAVYWCIVRQSPNARQRFLFEAFASREFAYLLVILTLAGRLDWFLWLSAVGTYVFATGLVVLGRRGA